MRTYHKPGSPFWQVDLRAEGFGCLSTGVPKTDPERKALARGAELLAEQRAQQGQLALELEAPRTLADLLTRWFRAERFPTTATRKFYGGKANTLRERWGHLSVRDFLGAGAFKATDDLITACHRAEYSSHTVKHFVDTLYRALTWGARIGRYWSRDDLLDAADRPRVTRDGEQRFYVPRSRVVTESEVWAMHYSPHFNAALRRWADAGNQDAADKVARRQVAVLLIFYLSLRASDVTDKFLWGYVDAERGVYLNVFAKTSRSHKPEPRRLPGALRERLLIEWQRQNRPARDVPVVGPWPSLDRGLKIYAALAGIQPFSSNDLRRGAASALLAGGLKPRDVAGHMGHTSSAMVETIYGMVPFDVIERKADEVFLSKMPPPPTVAPGAEVIPLRKELA